MLTELEVVDDGVDRLEEALAVHGKHAGRMPRSYL